MSPSEGSAIPRPEYPRPQFVRHEWLNLNGEWEFSTDTYDQGLRRGWNDGRSFKRRIQVPFAYQTRQSGINDQEIHQVAWYARGFEVAARVARRRRAAALWGGGLQDDGVDQWAGGGPQPGRARAVHVQRDALSPHRREPADGASRGHAGCLPAPGKAGGQRQTTELRLLLHDRHLADGVAGAGSLVPHRRDPPSSAGGRGGSGRAGSAHLPARARDRLGAGGGGVRGRSCGGAGQPAHRERQRASASSHSGSQSLVPGFSSPLSAADPAAARGGSGR